jgi:hypothetical protein
VHFLIKEDSHQQSLTMQRNKRMKSNKIFWALLTTVLLPVSRARAGDVPKFIAVEISPVAPVAAARESSQGNAASMWEFATDFNVNGKFTTGPELWLGTFAMRSKAESSETHVRREDLQYSERQKLDASSLKWNVTLFESGYSMRGWFIKTGYSYTKVLSRAHRYFEAFGVDDPENVESNIVDYRHGVYGAFGERWHFWSHNVTVSVAVNYTHYFRRRLEVESQDSDARGDYLELIERIPDTRLSARPIPAADFRVGFLF